MISNLSSVKVAFAISFLLGFVGLAQANSNGLLNGRYVGSADSVLWLTPTGGSPIKLDVAISGINYFDGRGNFFASYTDVFSGASIPISETVCTFTATGTYVLNDDDTGTLQTNATSTSGGCGDATLTFNLYATLNGSKVCVVQTSQSPSSPSGTTISANFASCETKQ